MLEWLGLIWSAVIGATRSSHDAADADWDRLRELSTMLETRLNRAEMELEEVRRELHEQRRLNLQLESRVMHLEAAEQLCRHQNEELLKQIAQLTAGFES